MNLYLDIDEPALLRSPATNSHDRLHAPPVPARGFSEAHPTMHPARALLFCMFALFTPAHLLAQSGPDTGFPDFGTFNRDAVDTINVGNLNVHIELPLFSKKGRRMDFSSKITFDNTPYRPTPPSRQGCTARDDWRLQPTWVAGAVSGTGSITYQSRSNGTQDPVCYLNGQGSAPTPYTIFYNFAFTDASDTAHSFGGFRVGYPAGCMSTSGTAFSFGGYTLSAVISPSTGAFTTLSMTDAKGNTNNFLARTLADPYGNTIGVSGSGASSTWTDTTGNPALKLVAGASPWNFYYPSPIGSLSEQASISYSNLTLQTNYQCPNPYPPDLTNAYQGVGRPGIFITGIALASRWKYLYHRLRVDIGNLPINDHYRADSFDNLAVRRDGHLQLLGRLKRDQLHRRQSGNFDKADTGRRVDLQPFSNHNEWRLRVLDHYRHGPCRK